MTLIVELTAEQEILLNRQATAAGIDEAEYIRTLIINAGKSGAEHMKTGAEVLDELKALNLPLGYGDPAIDSPELARQLRSEFSNRNNAH